ncbi:excinuclease ATPase subunit [Zhongshania borealis]|uniref:Phosphoribosylglycinamide formyltransferase n=1 Tax=Zhongshania borealis TaxID=889488 RepID=A0ABP7WHV9_9GAMM
MKRILILVVALMAVSINVNARDTKHLMSIESAMARADFKERLNSSVRFYFGDQAHPTPTQRFGERVTSKKTNGFNKTDRESCEWVLLSALLALEKSAIAAGGNAVVNIRSFYNKNAFSSTTEYECHTGAIITGVALTGDVVKLP